MVEEQVKYLARTFDWGENGPGDVFMITQEVFINRVYERCRQVKKDDVVLDIGANVGAFAYSILRNGFDRRPSVVMCLEPSESLVRTLSKNLAGDTALIVNAAIGSETGEKRISPRNRIYAHKASVFYTISFDDLIYDYNIPIVDFLKTDCEGGEYDLFSEENFGMIMNIVRYVAGEFHLGIVEDGYNKFIHFRDNYLRDSYRAFTAFHCNYDEDITEKIKDNIFIKDYIDQHGTDSQIMLYFEIKKRSLL